MASTEARDCCVCGKKTTNRCSSCATFGIDLFFCSREHQKLVWKNAHSKVCGKNANPFVPPDLTRDEAKQAVQLGRIDTRLEAPHLLCNTSQYPPEGRAEILRVARGLVHDILFRPDDPATATLSLSPFYLVAPFQKVLLQHFPALSATSLPFYQLSHLALILSSLLHTATQPNPPSTFDISLAIHALTQLQFAVSAAGTFQSYQHAVNIVRVLGTLVKPTLPWTMRFDIDPVTFKLREFAVEH
ncbi:hypothetical protein JCM6882_007523 [Rhodosporidiobolus microsporus]